MKLHGKRPQGLGRSGTAAVVVLALSGSALIAQGMPHAGPAADYPVVLGAPFVVDGVTYTPVDRMNYDQVGHAQIEAGGEGVSIAHRTLPLPSYAEVTSLRTGRTILVRVERRGPMTGSALIAMSPAAAAQLGTAEARTPIRIRRVNPPEAERALLRSGQSAPARMDTPMSLVAVLMRKLEPEAPTVAAGPPVQPQPVQGPTVPPRPVPARATAPSPAPASKPTPATRPAPLPGAVAEAKPLAAAKPAQAARPVPPVTPVTPVPPVKSAGTSPRASAQVVQVGAYSTRAAAEKVAARVGGTVSPAGKLFRVRMSGGSSDAATRAALAKAKAAGYSDARIQHAD